MLPARAGGKMQEELSGEPSSAILSVGVLLCNVRGRGERLLVSLYETRVRLCKCRSRDATRYSMCQPWLTITDWPVSAFDGKAAKKSATSATSSSVVNSPSTVFFSITFLITSASVIPKSRACSGICFSTRGVRTKPRQITLERTPIGAPSLATDLQRPTSPRLEG